NKVVENAKKTVSDAVGNDSLQSKGQPQNISGKIESTLVNVKRYATGAYNQASDAVKGTIDYLPGNTTYEAGDEVIKKKV
ncbi:hypothetical protein BD408DRAFT_462107, partial [Parasitella parasitica]